MWEGNSQAAYMFMRTEKERVGYKYTLHAAECFICHIYGINYFNISMIRHIVPARQSLNLLLSFLYNSSLPSFTIIFPTRVVLSRPPMDTWIYCQICVRIVIPPAVESCTS